jgi:outer membrane protein TolC
VTLRSSTPKFAAAAPAAAILAAAVAALATAAPARAQEPPRAQEPARDPVSPAIALPGSAGTPASTDTLRLSLDEAVERALAQGEEMRTARANVAFTAGEVRVQLSRALPQVNASLLYDRKLQSIFEGAASDTSDFGSLLENTPFAAENAWTAEVTAEQLLFSGGKVGGAIKAAKAAKRSALASEAETATNVTLSVKRAYHNAALAARLVAIAQRALEVAREHLAQVQSGRGQGSKSEYDVLRAEVDAANQEPEVIGALREQDIAFLALKRLVNVPLDRPVVLVTPLMFEEDLVPVVTERAPSTASRPALAAAEAEAEARKHVVGVTKGQHWPDLYVSTTYQQQAFPGSFLPDADDFRGNWDAYLTLRLPIFTGLRIEGQVSQARSAYEKAAADRDLLRELVDIEAVQARSDLDRTLSTLAARRKTVQQARRAWELAEVRYTNGMSTQLEVSDARLQLSDAAANEARAVRDYRVALAGLERAVGRPLAVQRMPLEEAARTLNPEGNR